jgi:hypothetical protein
MWAKERAFHKVVPAVETSNNMNQKKIKKANA